MPLEKSRGCNAFLDELPPHAFEAERAVLGILLLRPDFAGHVVHLRPEHFYTRAHAIIYAAIQRLRAAEGVVDTVTVRELLVDTHVLAASGGDDYLLSLTKTIPVAESLTAYADLILDRALRRHILRTTFELAQVAQQGPITGALLAPLSALVQQVQRASAVRHHDVSAAGSCARDLVTRLLAIGPRRRTGIGPIDSCLGGARVAEVIVLSRPHLPAHEAALEAAKARQARGADRPSVALLSHEHVDNVALKLLSACSGVATRQLLFHELDVAQQHALRSAAELLEHLPLVVASAGDGLVELCREVMRSRTAGTIDLLVVDMPSAGAGGSSCSVVQELAHFAIGHRVSVVVVVSDVRDTLSNGRLPDNVTVCDPKGSSISSTAVYEQ